MDLMAVRRKTIIDNSPHTVSTSGDLLRFKTDMAAPVDRCVVNFTPIQEGSGEPSLTNIRPISGFSGIHLVRCGKNLLGPIESAVKAGITYTVDNDGIIHASGTLTGSSTASQIGNTIGTVANKSVFNNGVMVKYGGCNGNPGTHKYWDIYPWDLTMSVRPKESETSTTNAKSIYTPDAVEEAYIPPGHSFRLVIRCNTKNVEYDNAMFSPWVYFDDEEDETFEKTYREEYDISFGGIGTVYGGSLDLLTGVLTTDYAFMSFDGTESWVSRVGDASENNYFSLTLSNSVLVSSNYRGCSHYPNSTVLTNTSVIGFHAHTSSAGGNKQLRFRPNLSEISTLAQWKNFLAEQYTAGTPVQCWWRYQEPVTYQLTPQQITTLNGTNNIWSNANGGIELKYWKR